MSLNGRALYRVTGGLCSLGQTVVARRADFLGRPAAVADQERRRMGLIARGAGDIGAYRGDAVGQTLALQKLQRAIDGGGLAA